MAKIRIKKAVAKVIGSPDTVDPALEIEVTGAATVTETAPGVATIDVPATPSGGQQSLDETITTAGGGTVDNDAAVPATDPIRFREASALDAITPLTVDKLEAGPDAAPAIKANTTHQGAIGVQVANTANDAIADLTAQGLVFEASLTAFYLTGPRTRGGANPGPGTDYWTVGGGGFGPGNDGGDLYLLGGAIDGTGNTPGKAKLGPFNTSQVELGAVTTPTVVLGPLIIRDYAGLSGFAPVVNSAEDDLEFLDLFATLSGATPFSKFIYVSGTPVGSGFIELVGSPASFSFVTTIRVPDDDAETMVFGPVWAALRVGDLFILRPDPTSSNRAFGGPYTIDAVTPGAGFTEYDVTPHAGTDGAIPDPGFLEAWFFQFPPVVPIPSDAAPLAVGTAAPGTGVPYSREDHIHAHGAQAGGTQHVAAVPSGASGFMTGTQAQKVDDDDVPGAARPPTAHAGTHSAGAGDPVGVANLSSGAATDRQIPVADGSGNINWQDPPLEAQALGRWRYGALGTGRFDGNDAGDDKAATTELELNDVDLATGTDRGSWIQAFVKSGARLLLERANDASDFAVYAIDSDAVDATGTWTIAVTIDSQGGPTAYSEGGGNDTGYVITTVDNGGAGTGGAGIHAKEDAASILNPATIVNWGDGLGLTDESGTEAGRVGVALSSKQAGAPVAATRIPQSDGAGGIVWIPTPTSGGGGRANLGLFGYGSWTWEAGATSGDATAQTFRANAATHDLVTALRFDNLNLDSTASQTDLDELVIGDTLLLVKLDPVTGGFDTDLWALYEMTQDSTAPGDDVLFENLTWVNGTATTFNGTGYALFAAPVETLADAPGALYVDTTAGFQTSGASTTEVPGTQLHIPADGDYLVTYSCRLTALSSGQTLGIYLRINDIAIDAATRLTTSSAVNQAFALGATVKLRLQQGDKINNWILVVPFEARIDERSIVAVAVT